MPSRPDKPRSRIHMWLPDEVIEWYKARYGKNPGFSKILTKVLENYMRKIEANAAQHMPPAPREIREEDLVDV